MAFCRPCVKSLADLLTSYDGKKISYDEIGNPTSYYNGKNWKMTWENGRQLSQIKRGSKTWDFTYDMSGVRSGKTVTTTDSTTGETTSTEYKYTTLSGKLVRVEYNTTVLDIVYDEAGQPFSIRYKSKPDATGTLYYYVLNIQGDVVGLLNAAGDPVVEYEYDPWGKLLETRIVVDETEAEYEEYNNMGLRNPLRYRGYIYDSDTGLYYLQSRYYDPAIGRFINADAFASTDTNDLLASNMFAYCENNPVMYSDPTGHWIIKNLVKWLAKEVVRPIVKSVQNTLANVDATFTTGLSLSMCTEFWSFNVQGGISIDTKGNVAIQGTGAGGLCTGPFGFSACGYNMITNAPNIYKLEGPGYQVGGTMNIAGTPIVVGGEANIIPDEELGKVYGGVTGIMGFGASNEVHVEWGETRTLKGSEFNIFDAAHGIYIKIMEW